MASINKTPNLNLTQFVASDKPAWLTDYNNDMRSIDEAVGATNEAVNAVEAAQQELGQQVSAQREDMGGLEARMGTALKDKADMADFEGSLFVDDTERQVGWYMTGTNGNGERLYKPWYEMVEEIATPVVGEHQYQYSTTGRENVEFSRGFLIAPTAYSRPLPLVLVREMIYAFYVDINTEVSYMIRTTASFGGRCKLYFTYTKAIDVAKTKAEILTNI